MGKEKKEASNDNKKPLHSPNEIRNRLKQRLKEKEQQKIETDYTKQFELLKQQLNGNVNIDTSEIHDTEKVVDKLKLFVATPCYNGTVHVKYMDSVMKLQKLLERTNIDFEFFTIPFDSLIPRARNACCTRFMADKTNTHLLFIDADIEFDPMSVIKMLKENKDVIGGCYSKKAIDFDVLYENYPKISNKLELLQSAGKYAFNFKPQNRHKVERGVIEVLDAPTGFLMIKRQVFEKMIKYYPEYEYKNDVGPYNVNQSDRFFDFFPSQIFEDNGIKRYLSEDYGFCRLWQKMDGKIFIDLSVQLNHIGQFTYYGNPMMFLKHSKDVNVEN